MSLSCTSGSSIFKRIAFPALQHISPWKKAIRTWRATIMGRCRCPSRRCEAPTPQRPDRLDQAIHRAIGRPPPRPRRWDASSTFKGFHVAAPYPSNQ